MENPFTLEVFQGVANTQTQMKNILMVTLHWASTLLASGKNWLAIQCSFPVCAQTVLKAEQLIKVEVFNTKAENTIIVWVTNSAN